MRLGVFQHVPSPLSLRRALLLILRFQTRFYIGFPRAFEMFRLAIKFIFNLSFLVQAGHSFSQLTFFPTT